MTYGQLRRLRRWARRGIAPPYALELNPTFRCNLRCLFCSGAQYGVTREGRDALSDGQCLDLVAQAGALGVREVYLAGDGDPLVRNRLAAEIIRAVKGAGMRGFLTTNGTLITAGIIEAAVGSRWDHFSISIDGPSAESYDEVTGSPGAFDRLMGNLEALQAARRRARSRRPRLHINTVLFKHTYDKLTEMVTLARDLGVPSISFEPFIPSPRVAHLDLGPEDLEALPGHVEEAERFARTAGISTNLPGLLEPGLVVERRMETLITGRGSAKEAEPEGTSNVPEAHDKGQDLRSPPGGGAIPSLAARPCYQPWTKLVVRPDGTAYPCCNFYEASRENVRDRSLREIWTGSYFEGMRGEIARGEMPRECEKCNEWLLRENRTLRRLLESRFLLPAYLRHLAGDLHRFIPWRGLPRSGK